MYQRLFAYLVFVGCCYALHLPLPPDELNIYFNERRELLKKSLDDSLGGHLVLNNEERVVNEILERWRNEEFDKGVKNPSEFWASQHFFNAKPHIEKSKVFRIIQKFPKGASLHSHETALVSADYIYYNITFRENIYAMESESGAITLKFFKQHPGAPWSPIAHLRQIDRTFGHRLKEQMTLMRNNTALLHSDVNTIWKEFQNIFDTMKSLLTYKPVFKDYFYQALREQYEDNIKYIEFRSTLPLLYDLDGTVYDQEETVRVYVETTKEFMDDYPDFWGAKLIFAPSRFTNNSVVEHYAHVLSRLDEEFPNFVAGFDLVGQEDPGPPLKDFIPSLLKMTKQSRLFLHAGETLSNGAKTDENLIDAVLLNATRIGHAYAILKHPEVMKKVKEQNIGLEICPISNQVLGLVSDLRNHPANHLIANNYPVIITSDDPSLWGAKGLSYDWYVAFMAMSSRHSDIRLLKQLAYNSILYSSMDLYAKEVALKRWENDWRTFLIQVRKDEIL
uniref:Adenosine deaminase n=1 Tax=Dendroctonus ponderosae TaxID=77166 RepID=A0AAR5Q0Y3_DENPD